MIQEQIDKIKISDTKIKKIIQSIEEKVETLSKEKNYDNQLKIILGSEARTLKKYIDDYILDNKSQNSPIFLNNYHRDRYLDDTYLINKYNVADVDAYIFSITDEYVESLKK